MKMVLVELRCGCRSWFEGADELNFRACSPAHEPTLLAAVEAMTTQAGIPLTVIDPDAN